MNAALPRNAVLTSAENKVQSKVNEGLRPAKMHDQHCHGHKAGKSQGQALIMLIRGYTYPVRDPVVVVKRILES
jgi:hypothetical protein